MWQCPRGLGHRYVLARPGGEGLTRSRGGRKIRGPEGVPISREAPNRTLTPVLRGPSVTDSNTQSPHIEAGRWVFPTPSAERAPVKRRKRKSARQMAYERIQRERADLGESRLFTGALERRAAIDAVPGIVYAQGKPVPQHSDAPFVERTRTVLKPSGKGATRKRT